jgi:hypothetical protein
MWTRAPVVELGVQQAVGRIQLAVGTGRVVEQLGRGRSTWPSSWKTSSWYPDGPPEPFVATTVLLRSC